VWTKDKSYHVRTKDQYVAARKRPDAKPDDLQTLREDTGTGLAGELKSRELTRMNADLRYPRKSAARVLSN